MKILISINFKNGCLAKRKNENHFDGSVRLRRHRQYLFRRNFVAVRNSPDETSFVFNSKRIKINFQFNKKILKKAIEARGTSDSDYRDPSGKKGKYQEMLFVYGLKGEKCQKNDGGIITRLKVGGRSAHFCPAHQKM